MPAQHVNGPSVAEVVERDLERDLPGSGPELGNRSVDEQGVGFVEQAIEALAAPSDEHVEVCSERPACPLETLEIGSRDQPPIQFGHERPRDRCLLGQVLLAPSEPDANGTNRATDPQWIHSAILSAVAHRRLVCGG